MWYLFLGLVVGFGAINAQVDNAAIQPYTDVEFVIFIPSYNNEKYALENLASVCHQNSSKPYHVICSR